MVRLDLGHARCGGTLGRWPPEQEVFPIQLRAGSGTDPRAEASKGPGAPAGQPIPPARTAQRGSAASLSGVIDVNGSTALTESARLLARADGLIPGQSQTMSKGPTQWVQGIAPAYLVRG